MNMAFIHHALHVRVRAKKEKMLEVADYSRLIEEFLVKWEVRKKEQTLGYIEGEVGGGPGSYRMWTDSKQTNF